LKICTSLCLERVDDGIYKYDNYFHLVYFID